MVADPSSRACFLCGFPASVGEEHALFASSERGFSVDCEECGPYAVTPDAIQDVPALRRTITNTLELGYKGLTAGRVWLTVDIYRNQVTDPLGDRYDLTPSVFYEGVYDGRLQYLRELPPGRTIGRFDRSNLFESSKLSGMSCAFKVVSRFRS